ncbi:WYL domain-containing protein [Actinomadura geliboluensis]|uniref:WYL domain-containing protein n=1 Tax=Actinomadura geliboluensis TaxID=882440 RepID=UPI003682B2EE
MAEAQLKLMAALLPESRDRAARLRERVHLDARSWCQDADAAPQLALVADAVWHQRCVRLHYLRWEAPHEVTRTVEPYGVVLKGRQLVSRRSLGRAIPHLPDLARPRCERPRPGLRTGGRL